MKREIYEVIAKVVDASGAYNNLNGYPKTFDSHQYNDDLDRNFGRANAAYNSAVSDGWTAFANGRPLTVVSLIRIEDGKQIEQKRIGAIPTLPDPEPEPEPEPEPTEGE